MNITENDRLRFASAVSAAEARVRAAGGIGTLGERTLHAALKLYYEPDTDLHEVGVGRFVADIKSDGGIIEIQTRRFASLAKKLDAFLPEGPVTVVYPLAAKKWIAMLDPETGTLGEKRKSPKKETPLDALWELSFILPHLGDANLTVRLPMLEVLEFRRRGGRRWKNSTTRLERLPLDLLDEAVLRTKDDYRALLPPGLPPVFTAADFKAAAKRSNHFTQKALKTLCALGVTERCGKVRNAYLYQRSED